MNQPQGLRPTTGAGKCRHGVTNIATRSDKGWNRIIIFGLTDETIPDKGPSARFLVSKVSVYIKLMHVNCVIICSRLSPFSCSYSLLFESVFIFNLLLPFVTLFSLDPL